LVDILPYGLYDEVEMKRPHPCAAKGKRFQIIRLGADIKIRCLACGNVLMLDRDDFNHKIKKVLAHHEGPLKVEGTK
jgi:hypothetical protein